jgi:hypothetical protein
MPIFLQSDLAALIMPFEFIAQNMEYVRLVLATHMSIYGQKQILYSTAPFNLDASKNHKMRIRKYWPELL